MNFVEVMGGLGNQMFQYTFSKWLERITGTESVLQVDFFDYVKYSNGTVREFELGNMNIKAMLYRGEVACRAMTEQNSDYSVDEVISDLCFYRGYWLNKKFFNEVKDVVRKDFTLRDELITQRVKDYRSLLGDGETVSLHVRRGDYLNNVNSQVFALMTDEYYKSAVRELIKRVGAESLKIYIFTDDYEYACANMKTIEGIGTTVIEPGSSCEDLYLMSVAKHHVIANSTYSWWGAALSETEGFTVYPDKWFLKKKAPDIFLDDWIKVHD